MLIIRPKQLWHAVIVIGIAFSSGEVTIAKTLTEYRHNGKLRQSRFCDQYTDAQQANQQINNTDSSTSPHPPRCTLSAEAIIFARVGTAKYTLVERVPGTTYFFDIPATPGKPALNSTNLKQNFSPGFRLVAVYHADSNHDLLLSFFYIGNWNSTRSIGPDNPLDWLVMRALGGFFQTQDFTYQSMRWDYSTKLYNAELSLQKKFSNRITMLAGFRWLQLHENLQGTIPPPDRIQPTWKSYPEADLAYVALFENQPGIPAPPYPPFWNTSTTNNLYGLQIGMVGKLFKCSRFSLDGLLNIGGYWNRASESTGVSIAKIVYDSGASTNHPAFVSEIGLQCKYQITNWIALKFGYEALWITGVALAPGQIKETYSTSTSVNALGVRSNSHVLFHGVTAGLELLF